MLRVALCMSGFARCFQLSMLNLRKHLLSNPELQVDIFGHTWSIVDRDGPKINERHIIKAYQPKNLVVEDIREFELTDDMKLKNTQKRNVSDLLCMYYKVEACNQLKIDYELRHRFKYDAVIRFRFDIKLNQPPDLNSKTNLAKIYVPRFGDYGGLNDQFGYGSSDNMNKYCRMFSNFSKVLTNMPVVNPEVIFHHYIMIDCDLEVVRPELDYILLHRRTNNYDWEVKRGFIA